MGQDAFIDDSKRTDTATVRSCRPQAAAETVARRTTVKTGRNEMSQQPHEEEEAHRIGT